MIGRARDLIAPDIVEYLDTGKIGAQKAPVEHPHGGRAIAKQLSGAAAF
jgi:hypothetical protein